MLTQGKAHMTATASESSFSWRYAQVVVEVCAGSELKRQPTNHPAILDGTPPGPP